MDNHFDRRERTIYVWMLERSVTDDQLYALFSKIGPIEKLIFKEYADGTPQHCLIVFRYVDSVLTAMSTLQGVELNGKPISLRPLRESTHAVLMPASTMYPTSGTKQRTTTVTSSDGLSDHSDDHHYGGGGKKQVRSNWDAVSSAGSASSGVWNTDGLESATEKLTIDERRGGNVGERSCTSYSSISSGAGSPHSLSPPPLPSHHQQQQYHHYAPSAIHGSMRKPWRPSRGPIPAPLLAPGGGFPAPSYRNQHHYQKEEYGSGGGAAGGYGSHVNLAYASSGAPPPSLFSQIIPPSPGCGFSPSPYTAPHHSTSFFGGGNGAVSSPRPLLPEMYKPTADHNGDQAEAKFRPTGVFSPTAAPEEVLWRQPHQAPPTPLMSPPCTAGGRNWFDYGEYSVPQAYRGSGTEQQLAAAAAAAVGQSAGGPPPTSLGGMLPPNSPPIGQCTRFFDFTEATSTLPRLRPHPFSGSSGPSSARPPLLSPWGGARCAPRAPRSAAPFGSNQAPPSFQHQNSPIAWPEFRTFGGRY